MIFLIFEGISSKKQSSVFAVMQFLLLFSEKKEREEMKTRFKAQREFVR